MAEVGELSLRVRLSRNEREIAEKIERLKGIMPRKIDGVEAMLEREHRKKKHLKRFDRALRVKNLDEILELEDELAEAHS